MLYEHMAVLILTQSEAEAAETRHPDIDLDWKMKIEQCRNCCGCIFVHTRPNCDLLRRTIIDSNMKCAHLPDDLLLSIRQAVRGARNLHPFLKLKHAVAGLDL